MRVEVWKSDAPNRSEMPWHFCLLGTARCENYTYFATWREAFDAACAELRKRGQR